MISYVKLQVNWTKYSPMITQKSTRVSKVIFFIGQKCVSTSTLNTNSKNRHMKNTERNIGLVFWLILPLKPMIQISLSGHALRTRRAKNFS